MSYDLDAISKRVSALRRRFIATMSIYAAVAVVSVLLIALNLAKMLTFISTLLAIAALFCVFATLSKHSPAVLFSREIRGTSIREDEYTVSGSSGPGMRYKQEGAKGFGGPPIAPSTGANKKSRPPSMRSAVYLRLDSGNIIMVRGLYRAHTDIYEYGDELLKPAGAKYPIVIGREPGKQPCPMCGEINDMQDPCCRSCGIPIITTISQKEITDEDRSDSTR